VIPGDFLLRRFAMQFSPKICYFSQEHCVIFDLSSRAIAAIMYYG